MPLSCHHSLIRAHFSQTSFLSLLSTERQSPRGQADEEQENTKLGRQASLTLESWQLRDVASVQAYETLAFQHGDELHILCWLHRYRPSVKTDWKLVELHVHQGFAIQSLYSFVWTWARYAEKKPQMRDLLFIKLCIKLLCHMGAICVSSSGY